MITFVAIAALAILFGFWLEGLLALHPLDPRVAETRKRSLPVIQSHGHASFTCDRCSAANECDYAFDPYNTNGDCLAEK